MHSYPASSNERRTKLWHIGIIALGFMRVILLRRIAISADTSARVSEAGGDAVPFVHQSLIPWPNCVLWNESMAQVPEHIAQLNSLRKTSIRDCSVTRAWLQPTHKWPKLSWALAAEGRLWFSRATFPANSDAPASVEEAVTAPNVLPFIRQTSRIQ